MTKQKAKQIYGNVKHLSEKVGFSPSYFYQLPDPLPQREADRLIGAAVRVGILHLHDNQTIAE